MGYKINPPADKLMGLEELVNVMNLKVMKQVQHYTTDFYLHDLSAIAWWECQLKHRAKELQSRVEEWAFWITRASGTHLHIPNLYRGLESVIYYLRDAIFNPNSSVHFHIITAKFPYCASGEWTIREVREKVLLNTYLVKFNSEREDSVKKSA